MNTSVIVKDVIERNNCCGIKTVIITAQAQDETVSSKFIMTNDFRSPIEKLMLASVEPDDEVLVRVSEHFLGPQIVGEFYAIKNMTGYRRYICKCGSSIMSDGQIVMCSNENCGLSIMARIERLSKTPFFLIEGGYDFPVMVKDNDQNWDVGWDISQFKYDPSFVSPFNVLMDPRFWNTFENNLENIFIKNQNTISLATFLIEEQFRHFIDSYFTIPYTPEYPFNSLGMDHGNNFKVEWKNIGRFYELMNEVIFSRKIESKRQNYFLYQFLYSLGLESLTPLILESLISYELGESFSGCDPLLLYLNALTSPRILIHELGVHDLQAQLIIGEFKRRRFEMHDIFSAYSNISDVAQILHSNNIIISRIE